MNGRGEKRDDHEETPLSTGLAKKGNGGGSEKRVVGGEEREIYDGNGGSKVVSDVVWGVNHGVI